IFAAPCSSAVGFFFFRAEDGIRDGHVTGVQTCALPIYEHGRRRQVRPPGRRALLLDPAERERAGTRDPFPRRGRALPGRDRRGRSEERRVGKKRKSGLATEKLEQETVTFAQPAAVTTRV